MIGIEFYLIFILLCNREHSANKYLLRQRDDTFPDSRTTVSSTGVKVGI
jgi:hypothetical protein